MRPLSTRLSALIAIGSIACSASHTPDRTAFDDAGLPAPDTGPTSTVPRELPFDRFCEAFADAACTRRDRCRCPSMPAFAQCVSSERTRCMEDQTHPAGLVLPAYGGGTVVDAIASGALSYDAVAAASFIEEMATSNDCDRLGPPFEDLAAAMSLNGVFRGALEPGAACAPSTFFPNPCAGSNYCTGSVCIPFAREGSACGRSSDCILSDDYFSNPLVCFDGVCQRGRDNGDTCTWSAQCLSAYCLRGACGGPLEGSACAASLDCGFEGLYCEAGSCRSLRPSGSACEEEAQCYGTCQLGSCAPQVCAVGDSRPG